MISQQDAQTPGQCQEPRGGDDQRRQRDTLLRGVSNGLWREVKQRRREENRGVESPAYRDDIPHGLTSKFESCGAGNALGSSVMYSTVMNYVSEKFPSTHGASNSKAPFRFAAWPALRMPMMACCSVAST